MSETMSFKDKIKTIQVMGRTGQGSRVTEGATAAGVRTKSTREGDPDVGYVTHTEHAKGDRVDATVTPKPIAVRTYAQNG